MANQSMSSRKRALDCLPTKSSLKKKSTSEVPEKRTPKWVSFSVQTPTEPSKGSHNGIEVSVCRQESNDERGNGNGVNFHRKFNYYRTKSGERVKSRTKFNHYGNKKTEGRLQSVSPTRCRKNGPVKDFIWSGIVEVVDCGKLRMSEEMIVHISSKISRKAFETSKKIDSKLQFKLFPRSDFYPKIFQDACPDRDDIALYFYPTKAARSRKQYSRLLKDMELKDLMMRSQVDGRELLVYPSTILTTDSQKLEISYFMWGVFGSKKSEDMQGDAYNC